MAYLTRYIVTPTTDGTSAATAYTSTPVNGFVESIIYVPHATAPYSTAAALTVKAENSSVTALSVAAFNSTVLTEYYPRINLQSTAGSTVAAFGPVPIASERIAVALTGAGSSKTGTFHLLVGG